MLRLPPLNFKAKRMFSYYHFVVKDISLFLFSNRKNSQSQEPINFEQASYTVLKPDEDLSEFSSQKPPKANKAKKKKKAKQQISIVPDGMEDKCIK